MDYVVLIPGCNAGIVLRGSVYRVSKTVLAAAVCMIGGCLAVYAVEKTKMFRPIARDLKELAVSGIFNHCSCVSAYGYGKSPFEVMVPVIKKAHGNHAVRFLKRNLIGC